MAKVSDFGLSVKVDEFFGHVSNARHGTPFYMAPEVTRAGFLSMAADSYSFGTVSLAMQLSMSFYLACETCACSVAKCICQLPGRVLFGIHRL